MSPTISEHAATAGYFLNSGHWTAGGLLTGFVGLLVIVGILAVLVQRFTIASKGPSDSSMTRPVLALILVGTLVVLAAASMSMGDTQTRNLLIGGVVSLSSAAMAFYFSSKGATEARRDLLKATAGTLVPDLAGKTFAETQEMVSATSLSLVKPDPAPTPGQIVKSQEPKAHTAAAPGTPLTLTFGDPA
jgi:hypothetical protein